MFERICHIDKELEDSIFLFGARQTGKSTFLRQKYPDAIYIDLLDTAMKGRLKRRPTLLYEMLCDKSEGTLIIIDEIPEVPELLNEVHRLMSEKNLVFILCGSSARKLKRNGYNTLGGRAYPVYLFPFVTAEIPNVNLQQAINYGMLPPHYLAKNPHRRLAQDCGVSANTVVSYFDILEDTLLGFRVPAYTKTLKRRLVQAPRFYYFDVGIVNHLLHRKELVRGTAEYGHAFEHLVIQELRAWLSYSESEEKLSYWRTYTGLEVDAVIGDARIAIEIKSVEEVMYRHLKGLKAFAEDYPDSRQLVVSLDPINRRMGNIECIYVLDFFKMLWKGQI